MSATHVVGSGPNGLAAAIVLAEAGHGVTVHEAAATAGGGVRSAELTLPGYRHDVCSAIHPMAVSSPFFAKLELERHGLVWVQPPAPFAHPLDDGTAVVCERSVGQTAAGLGDDGRRYEKLYAPLVQSWAELVADILAPLLHVPRHPWRMARFGWLAAHSANGLAARFRGERARALLAGAAAHAVMPLEHATSAAFALVLTAAAHAVGWPFPRGGAQTLADVLVGRLRAHGGEVRVGARIHSLAELGDADAVMLDLTPRQVERIAGKALPDRFRRRLAAFRHGPGAFKIDWALDGPIPWRAAACQRAATVHVGGTFAEIARAERQAWEGEPPAQPFVLLAQPTLFDASRAPTDKHTAWGYCHVPNGSTFDMTERIEAQIERFAPGFRRRVLARCIASPAVLEQRNANLIGGDINAGRNDLWQVLARPRLALCPYATPNERIFVCSASTPPGGGVHGMCGFHAARAALRRVLR